MLRSWGAGHARPGPPPFTAVAEQRAARCPGGRARPREGLGRTALGESGRAQGEGDLGQPGPAQGAQVRGAAGQGLSRRPRGAASQEGRSELAVPALRPSLSRTACRALAGNRERVGQAAGTASPLPSAGISRAGLALTQGGAPGGAVAAVWP